MSGLAIQTLSLSHFRSHFAARMVFDGRPVAIAGANGAGKTNILEAVSLLSPGRGLRGAGAAEMARRPEGLGWKISARIAGLTAAHEIATSVEGDSARQVLLDGKPAPQLRLAQVLRVLWLVPAMDRLWIEGAEGRRRFLDRITLGFYPDHGETVLAYEKAMRDRNRLLRDGITDDRWYGALEAQMAEAGQALSFNRMATLNRLEDAQEGASSAFPKATLALEEPPEGLTDLAAALAEHRRRDIQAGRTLIGPHRADLAATYAAKDAPAAQCSTGEQKALLISLILASARALAEDLGRAPVILLDEVAAHLDPERRAALYDEICALGAQALMTGTEPGLFDGLGSRAQHLTIRDADGQSIIEEVLR